MFESTALIAVSLKGYTEIAKALIAAGADVNIENEWGYTALDLADSYGTAEIVKILIAAGSKRKSEFRLMRIKIKNNFNW